MGNFWLPIGKGWVAEHTRSGGRVHVPTYWRGGRPSTWEDHNLPSWSEIMQRRHAELTVLPTLRTDTGNYREAQDAVEEFIRSVAYVFTGRGKDYATINVRDVGAVRLDRDFGTHMEGWPDKWKRARFLPAAFDTLISPWEIWRQPVGKAAHDGFVLMKGFRGRGRSMTVYVAVVDEAVRLWTIVPKAPNAVDKERFGELVFRDYE